MKYQTILPSKQIDINKWTIVFINLGSKPKIIKIRERKNSAWFKKNVKCWKIERIHQVLKFGISEHGKKIRNITCLFLLTNLFSRNSGAKGELCFPDVKEQNKLAVIYVRDKCVSSVMRQFRRVFVVCYTKIRRSTPNHILLPKEQNISFFSFFAPLGVIKWSGIELNGFKWNGIVWNYIMMYVIVGLWRVNGLFDVVWTNKWMSLVRQTGTFSKSQKWTRMTIIMKVKAEKPSQWLRTGVHGVLRWNGASMAADHQSIREKP